MSTPGNLSEQIVAAPNGAGDVRSLGETFTPDLHTGTGRCRIPIALEPGPAGIAPALSLAYASTAGSDVAGLGWEIDLACIRRRIDKGIPVYDDTRDRFALQGDELVAQGGSAWRFRVEGRFARIRRLTADGNDAWVVTDRDGTRTLYGEVPSARLSDGAGRVAAWYLTRKQDVHGNEVAYTYERDPRTTEVRLVSIDWGGCYRVRIGWEQRPDPIVSARAGFHTRIEQRVSAIELQVALGDAHEFRTYRRYALRYSVSRWTGRSLLARVAATGIAADGAERTLPPLTFGYGDADLSRARWREIVGDRPGQALSTRNVTLVRQSGSGLPDVFETRPTGHYLRVNTGGGHYAQARAVAAPALVALSDAGTFLSDMDGDGYADLVVQGGRRVYTAAPRTGGWGGTYRAAEAPSVDLDAPDLKLADLTGNGLPDALRSGVSGWMFFENLGEGRWGPAQRIMRAPPVRLDDPRVHLADVDGDGLADLVYVDDSGVTVWPSLSRGQFGAPYRMLGALRFGGDFKPRHVRFIDLTGSGQADLVYVRDGVAQVAFNQAGVGLSALIEVGRSALTSQGFVEVADVLGTGADGLLYTDQGGAWRFRELFTAGPLDLLSSIDNGIGGTTAIVYGTSATHWARDLAAGRPWRTSMPNATQVVDRVTTTDRVTGRVLEVSYQYAHGVYDGREREFRGFARVAQVDREAPLPRVIGDLEPPAQARVVRWYHTGAPLDLRDEWFPIPGAPIEDDVPSHPWARRAMRGLVCREETYALDGERRPYLVTEHGYHVLAVGRSSARLESAWTPLAVHARRTVLERTSEARQSEVFTTYDLQEEPAGGYGLPVMVREIGHGRSGTFSTGHEQQQTESLERVTRTAYVSLDRPEPDDIAGPYVPVYVVGKPSIEERFGASESGLALLSRSRSFYDGDVYKGLGYPGSGTAPGLTRGRLSARLDLAFTTSSFDIVYPAGSGAAAARDARGQYLADGGEYYIHGCRMAYHANGLPARYLDPNGHETTVEYDATHGLFPVRLTDPADHPTILERGTLPFQVAALVDANDNRTEFTYDPTSLPAAKSVMGKLVDGSWQGDPPAHPTETYDYDFDSIPIRVTTKKRQIREGATLDVYKYIDGLGRAIQERHTAEPDPVTPSTQRFRVTGWQEFNHKGLVVRSFQPYFSASAAFAPGETDTPALTTDYDPLGRKQRVTYPDGTFETFEQHAWLTVAHDRNDNAGGLTADDVRYGPHLDTFRAHLGTPKRTYVDAFGREIATVEDNGAADSSPQAAHQLHVTRSTIDLRDRVVEIRDARDLGFPTWRFAYDLTGRRVLLSHATAIGDRFTLCDAAGNAIWSRDARGLEIDRRFDVLHRPLAETTSDGKLRRLWRYAAYDPADQAGKARNVFGRIEEQRDTDGLRFFDYDWRGLVIRASHRFWDAEWTDPSAPFWRDGEAHDPAIADGDRESLAYLPLSDLPDPVTVTMSTAYDAAGHPLEVSFPAGMSQRSTWNAAGLLARLEYDRGDGAGPAIAIDRVAYNARGQVSSWRHGNGVETTRDYDPALELLTRIATQAPGAILQDLRYAYDPIGNVVEITDALSPTPIVANLVVPNTRTFRYDPRYRLVRATGKRHREAASGVADVLIPNPDPNDYRPYTMRYGYDPVGNFTTNEEYAAARDAMRYKVGRIDLFNGSSAEAIDDDPARGNWRYDANGNCLHTPRQAALGYTADDLLRYVDLGGGGQIHYRRHGEHRAVRFVNKPGVFALGIYIGPWEYHRRIGVVSYSKVVLHAEAAGRHAQAERVLAGSDPDSLDVFFMHGDHLSSPHVLTRRDATLLSQEEFFAYGRSSDRRDARNRYRYIGVERDEDTGLVMCGPRTYDSTIGRFLQADAEPLAEVAPHAYALLNPLGRADRTGRQPPPVQAAPAANRWQPVPAVANPGIRVTVDPYTVDQELISWTSYARTSGRNVANLEHIPAAYVPNNVGVNVTAAHLGGNRYQADVTVTWDPNGHLVFDASQPEERITELNAQSGLTVGAHERLEHGAFVRNIMGADYVNGVVNGTLTWTARSAGQEVRGTEPSAFNGPQVTFQPLPVPQVFDVTLPNGPDAVKAGEMIQAELKATLGAYIDQSIQYSMNLMAHGPGYRVASMTPYTQDTTLGIYNVAPPPAPPRQINAQLP